jgi:hypothetical protein
MTRILAIGCSVLLVNAWAAQAANLFGKKPDPLVQSLPLAQLAEPVRAKVRAVAENAALATRGPAESFVCKAEHYNYFLDNPDRAVTAWRRLGAKCISIEVCGNQQYSWSDEHGSFITWETILRGPGIRVWFAEGKVRSSAVTPLVPVKVVVVLRYAETPKADGATAITHQSDIFVHTDSDAISLFAKLFGASAKSAADRGLREMQMFFSVLSWHMHREPDIVPTLLRNDSK